MATEPPPEIVDRVRVACAHLPEANEERAFVGTRWRIRGNTLAHVHDTATDQGAVTVITFHSRGAEAEALLHAGHPFYEGWGPGLVAMVLDDTTDWEEVAELLTESYCLLAPKKLVALLDRPAAGD
ncbi:MAG TPA: MmcQ/YjbR family DNA-binding protein [Acidimicrobiales bacterium]|nr:MmcQ/YjbR family DNA-binding protein [Acidimicrobiales bacterium]